MAGLTPEPLNAIRAAFAIADESVEGRIGVAQVVAVRLWASVTGCARTFYQFGSNDLIAREGDAPDDEIPAELVFAMLDKAERSEHALEVKSAASTQGTA